MEGGGGRGRERDYVHVCQEAGLCLTGSQGSSGSLNGSFQDLSLQNGTFTPLAMHQDLFIWEKQIGVSVEVSI